MAGRVVGSDLIEDARQRGRVVFEILPDDIVTDMAEKGELQTIIKDAAGEAGE